MQKPKYFKLEEFLESDTALNKKIKNYPSWEVIENLNELALFLDGLREDWGSAINVSSGFRSEALNKEVRGVPSSLHKKGLAADIMPANGHFDAFVSFIKEWAKDKSFDQILIETSKTSKWVHIGLRNNAGDQRGQLFDVTVYW
jgi:hypothetical protein